jgi:hypothetical protein
LLPYDTVYPKTHLLHLKDQFTTFEKAFEEFDLTLMDIKAENEVTVSE